MSTFGLDQGDLVKVKVTASNAIGAGPQSTENSSGALIEVVPHTPTVGPSRNSATTTTSITVDWQSLTGLQTGGSTILSYELSYDQATSSFTVLVGGSAPADYFTGL